MNRYEEAFEWMAERGEPAGAAIVVQRVKAQLAAGTGDMVAVGGVKPHSSGRGLRSLLNGPAVAVSVFLLVIAIGAVVWGIRGLGGESIPADSAGVTWLPGVGQHPGPLFAGGPDGFVRADFGIPIVHFSADGEVWESIELPDGEGLVVTSTLVSDGSGWLAVGTDSDDLTVAWVSSDGRSWMKVDLPDSLQGSFIDVESGPGGYLAVTRQPGRADGAGLDGVDGRLWWSADGASWEELVPSGLTQVPATILGHASGFVGWDSGDAVPSGESLNIYISTDAVEWITVQLLTDPEGGSEAPVEWQLFAAEAAGDTWLVAGAARESGTDLRTVVWTSTDGTTWNGGSTPSFAEEDGVAKNLLTLLSTGTDFVAVVGASEVYVYETGFHFSQWSTVSAQIWVSRDGQAWAPGQRFEKGVADAAIALIDGESVGVWYPSPRALGTEPVVTTVTSPPTEDLDPIGLALQDEILADGEVTKAEFESAVAGMADCVADHGAIDVRWSVEEPGDWSFGYRADSVAEADVWYCRYSYVEGL